MADKKRRKPLPYAATGLIEEARGHRQKATEALVTVVDKPTTMEEKYRLIGKAIHELNQIEIILCEIPVICEEK